VEPTVEWVVTWLGEEAAKKPEKKRKVESPVESRPRSSRRCKKSAGDYAKMMAEGEELEVDQWWS